MDVSYLLIGGLYIKGGFKQIVKQVPQFGLFKEHFAMVSGYYFSLQDMLIVLALEY